MQISIFRNRSTSDTDGSDRSAASNDGHIEIKPGTSSPPSALRGLRRLENGLRKVLPQPLTHSLFRRSESFAPSNVAPADAARAPLGEAHVAPASEGNRASGSSGSAELNLVDLATAVERFRNESVRRIEIDNILRRCETGRATMDDDLARSTFSAIASLQDTPRDDLLERALDLACRNPPGVSPEVLMNDRWLSDERLQLFERTYPAVMASDDTPDRARRLASLVSWLHGLPPSAYDAAMRQVIDAVSRTNVESRWEPLIQLQILADRQWHDSPDRGRLLVAIDELGGGSLRSVQRV